MIGSTSTVKYLGLALLATGGPALLSNLTDIFPTSITKEAPFVGAVIFVVWMFLRHMRESNSMTAKAIEHCTAAIEALREDLLRRPSSRRKKNAKVSRPRRSRAAASGDGLQRPERGEAPPDPQGSR